MCLIEKSKWIIKDGKFKTIFLGSGYKGMVEYSGDFNLKDDLISRNNENEFIYTGCQIVNKKVFLNFQVQNFPISKIWNVLIENNRLYGFESLNKFYHLTNLKIFKKLKDL